MFKKILHRSKYTQTLENIAIQGKTNKQLSEELFLSLRTIEVHRSNVMKKLQVHNLAELAKNQNLTLTRLV